MTKYSGKENFNCAIFVSLLFCLAVGCTEKKLGPNDVEYRKDENGSQILYEIGAKKPFGTDKQAFVVGHYPNDKDKKHFQISFLNGLKNGPFYFWQKNLPSLLAHTRKVREMGFL